MHVTKSFGGLFHDFLPMKITSTQMCSSLVSRYVRKGCSMNFACCVFFLDLNGWKTFEG